MRITARVLTYVCTCLTGGFIAHGALAADQTILPAAACIPTQPYAQTGFASYGEAYSYNRTEYEWIACGLGQNQATDTNDDIRVYFADNNVDGSGDNNVLCYAYEVDEDNSSVVYAGSKYGCATSGGCTSDPGSYQGNNYIDFADVTHGGEYRASLFCRLPIQSAGQYSTLRTLWIDEQ